MSTTRLASIQSRTDGFTTAVLDGLGVEDGWHCLELGAGAGSIASWLATRCPAGRVVAVDVDTSHLTGEGFEVVRADVTGDAFAPGRFDLVHARFLLYQLPDREEVLARAASWLRPGGWLVVTDPYQLPPAESPFPVVRKIMAAYQRVYPDLTWARHLPTLLARNGLTSIDFAGRPGCLGNGDRDRWRPLIEHAAPSLLATGAVTQADLDEFRDRLADPTFVDIPQLIIAAWGRAPEPDRPATR